MTIIPPPPPQSTLTFCYILLKTLSSFPLKRPPALNTSKGFAKKNDLLNAKYSKVKQSKIKTRNERPDIFLEGEQLARVNSAWQQEVDMRYF